MSNIIATEEYHNYSSTWLFILVALSIIFFFFSEFVGIMLV